MIAVGNDVVDLRDPDSDSASLNPRFDEKVFAAVEREALACAADPNRLRWTLWAAKEASYKAARKISSAAIFSPSRFVACSMLRAGAESGRVEHANGQAVVAVSEADGAVHAIALQSRPGWPISEDGTGLLSGVRRLDPGDPRTLDPQGPSQAVRTFAVERLAGALGVGLDELEIRRRERIPELWVGARRSAFDLSLSHHGSVVAFAGALPSDQSGEAGFLERCA